MTKKEWAAWEIFDAKTNDLIIKFEGRPTIENEVGKGIILTYFYFKKESKLVFQYTDGVANIKPHIFFYLVHEGETEPKYSTGRFQIWDFSDEAMEVIMEGPFYKCVKFKADKTFRSEDPISKYFIKIKKNSKFDLLV